MADAGGDQRKLLKAAINDARRDGKRIAIKGAGTKAQLLAAAPGDTTLSVAAHRGVVSYRPEELVITARAGTPVEELVEATAVAGQCLPFEAPLSRGLATLGGTLASGIGGPARPWRGSMRDALLGLRLINGRGDELRFGGEVIKNVAGYDVARLQAGARGALGLISEVSLKLLPAPAARLRLMHSCDAAEGLALMRALARRPLPLSGAFWRGDAAYLRFEGSEAAMAALRAEFKDLKETDDTPWEALREWRLPEVSPDGRPWLVDLAPGAPLDPGLQPSLVDWAGARRCFSGDTPPQALRDYARSNGGSLQQLGGGATARTANDPILAELLSRIKGAMDPDNVFADAYGHGPA